MAANSYPVIRLLFMTCFVVIVVWSAVIQLSSDLRVNRRGGGGEVTEIEH